MLIDTRKYVVGCSVGGLCSLPGALLQLENTRDGHGAFHPPCTALRRNARQYVLLSRSDRQSPSSSAPQTISSSRLGHREGTPWCTRRPCTLCQAPAIRLAAPSDAHHVTSIFCARAGRGVSCSANTAVLPRRLRGVGPQDHHTTRDLCAHGCASELCSPPRLGAAQPLLHRRFAPPHAGSSGMRTCEALARVTWKESSTAAFRLHVWRCEVLPMHGHVLMRRKTSPCVRGPRW